MAEEHKDWERRKIETADQAEAVKRLRWLADMIEAHGFAFICLDEDWTPPKSWKQWDDTWMLDVRVMTQMNDSVTPEMLEARDE
jgi:hypothetical protein